MRKFRGSKIVDNILVVCQSDFITIWKLLEGNTELATLVNMWLFSNMLPVIFIPNQSGLSWGSSQAETARLQRQYVGNPMYSQIRNIFGISGIVAISLKYIFG